MDLLDLMMGWESGDLDEDEEISLFQELVSNGQAWTLQGMYGRRATELVLAGKVNLPKE